MTPQRIYRAVFGAVKNTADGHPDWPINEVMAQSIAKRATGTLTALGSDVLAARAPSERADGATFRRHRSACAFGSTTGRTKRRGASVAISVKAGKRRSQLRRLHNELSAMVGPAKWGGRPERAEALIEVLRLIDRMRKE